MDEITPREHTRRKRLEGSSHVGCSLIFRDTAAVEVENCIRAALNPRDAVRSNLCDPRNQTLNRGNSGNCRRIDKVRIVNEIVDGIFGRHGRV